MTRVQQRKIANDLITGLRQNVNNRIKNIPENWDGFEIRQWITDLARENISWHPFPSQNRERAYNNDRVVQNP